MPRVENVFSPALFDRFFETRYNAQIGDVGACSRCKYLWRALQLEIVAKLGSWWVTSRRKEEKGNCRPQTGNIETRQHSMRSVERTVVRSVIVLLRLVRHLKAMLFDRPVVRLLPLPRYCEGRLTL